MTELTEYERIDKIADKCLKLLEDMLEDKPTQYSAPAEVKAIGESLKALAEGLESYHRISKTLKDERASIEAAEKMMEKARNPNIETIKI